MSLWAVVLLGSDEREEPAPGPDRSIAEVLRACAEGVVTVAAQPGRTRLESLRAALDDVPAQATLVALVSEADGDVCARIAERARLLEDGAAAAVRGRPVVDALKRVERGLVVGGVDRTGLYAPDTPQVLRLAPLRDALAAGAAHPGEARPAADAGGAPADADDPAVLLAQAGHEVIVISDDGADAARRPSAERQTT